MSEGVIQTTEINKLTIKDLNCGNCPNRNKSSCPLIKSYRDGCIKESEKPSIKVIHKIMEYHNETIKEHGCASHPLATQVIVAPVISELGKMDKRSEKDLPKDNVYLTPKEMRADERCYTLRYVINLLKNGVKE